MHLQKNRSLSGLGHVRFIAFLVAMYLLQVGDGKEGLRLEKCMCLNIVGERARMCDTEKRE